MSLADEVLAKHQRTYNEWREGGFCSKCKEAFPCESVIEALQAEVTTLRTALEAK
jgi:hypothetical protein